MSAILWLCERYFYHLNNLAPTTTNLVGALRAGCNIARRARLTRSTVIGEKRRKPKKMWRVRNTLLSCLADVLPTGSLKRGRNPKTQEALKAIRSQVGHRHDPEVVAALRRVVEKRGAS
jgi:hypothetical protein